MPDNSTRHGTRRRWIVGGALSPLAFASGAAVQAGAAASEVWIELSEPVPAGAEDAAQARQQRLRVAAQQERVAQRLRELGITELGRIVHSRNAMLVRVTPQQAEAVLAIPGVQRLRPVQSLHPPKPTP
jgi:hypothetical protein